VVVGPTAPIGGSKCLGFAIPPLPFGGRSNCLAAAQLRPANGEERQLHGRTQAREFGVGDLSKPDALRIAVAQDPIPCCIRLSGALPTEPLVKKNPRCELGAEGHHHEHLSPVGHSEWRPTSTNSRRGSVLALSDREHLPGMFTLNLHQRLLALLPSNSGEGLAKVRVNAIGVMKGTIEYRFHWCPCRVCVVRTFLSLIAARCVPGPRKSRWFSGLDQWPFAVSRVTVKSLDIHTPGIATTCCNAHAW